MGHLFRQHAHMPSPLFCWRKFFIPFYSNTIYHFEYVHIIIVYSGICIYATSSTRLTVVPIDLAVYCSSSHLFDWLALLYRGFTSSARISPGLSLARRFWFYKYRAHRKTRLSTPNVEVQRSNSVSLVGSTQKKHCPVSPVILTKLWECSSYALQHQHFPPIVTVALQVIQILSYFTVVESGHA